MCGLVGFFSYADQAPLVQEAELITIRDAMVPRGPDDCGIWLSANHRVGLAHRRLSIIDLSTAGRQPMATADDLFNVVFNGEIYNYLELRNSLESKGYVFRTNSDTEVLLHLYADKGQEMVNYLRGMFAFAIWDAKKQGLFIARDAFGIKPLYYSDDGKTIRISSQVKSLLQCESVDKTPESAGHAGFFLWGHVPEPYTLYKGIKAIPAGTAMWIDRGSVNKPYCYFNLAEKFSIAESGVVNLNLRNAMLDTVSKHLQADVPVGIFLSAGLDSTSLVALASELHLSDLRTVTLGFHEYKNTHNDEVPIAEAVAKHYGTNHTTIWVKKEDFQADYNNIIQSMDQPTIDGVNTYFVSKIAAQSGLKVALSGLGGDEMFGGYVTFNQIPKMVAALKWAKYIPFSGLSFRHVFKLLMSRKISPKYASLLEYGGDYAGAYLLRRGLYMPWELPDILGIEMAQEGLEELQPFNAVATSIQGVTQAHHKLMALELQFYMRNQLLRDSDWASMAHSLEIRVPFVDTNLFAGLVRSSQLSKHDVVNTLSRPLPDMVLQRKKTGFNVPVNQWVLGDKKGESEYGLRGWAQHVYALNTAV